MKRIFYIVSLCLLASVPAVSQTWSTSYGVNAGSSSSWSSTFGFEAGKNMSSSGVTNSYFGYRSGYLTTTGAVNSFFGANSGYNNTTGKGNVFMGSSSGYKNITGGYNVFLGYSSGYSYLSGIRNVVIGPQAAYSKTSGDENVILGYNAARTGTGGSYSAIIGAQSFYKGSGSYNSSLGYQSGYSNTGSRNVFIGYQAGYYETGSDKLYIDPSSTANPLIKGDFSSNQLGVNVGSFQSGYALTVGGSIYSSGKLAATTDIIFGANRWLDDDTSVGGHNDDWIRLNGFVEMKSNTDSYGIVLRDKDNDEYLGLTQRDGWSYLSDTQANSSGYFLRGNASNVEIPGTLKVGGKLVQIDDWNTAFGQRGSVIAGNGLEWSSGKLNITASAIDPSAINYFSKSGNNLSYSAGNLGIGTSSPAASLHITGTNSDYTPNIAGTQIKSGAIELTGNNTTPYIDFQNDINGIDYDARIILGNDNKLEIVGADLSLNNQELRHVRGIQLRDWDSHTAGEDNTFRLLGRDGAWMFYNGGVAIGQYGNGTWSDLADGTLIVQNKIGVGRNSPGYSLDVQGDIRAVSGHIRTTGDYGLYNNDDNTQFYSDDTNFWRMLSDRGLRIANKANVQKGFIYHDNTNAFGLLDGDGNWGLRLQRDTYTSFSINDSEKMRIHANGKVGIGVTTDPVSMLQVDGVITAQDGNSSEWNLAYDQRGELLGGRGLAFTDGKLNLDLGSDHWAFNNRDLTGINNVQINDPGDSEGITWGGTSAKISVSQLDGGQTDGFLRLINDGGISFEAGLENREDMIIDADGKVGIGTTSPQETLHIQGSVRGSDDLSGALQIKTVSGTVDIGAQNDGWAHLMTDRDKFYFNKGITVDNGMISSYDEPLMLGASGKPSIYINKDATDVHITSDLLLKGQFRLNPTKILLDNNPDELLVMKGDGTIVKRSVESIESPWLLQLMGQDTAIMSTIGTEDKPIIIDVFDLNGNLRIGDNSYIDDDLEYGDNGADHNEPDDWMRFADRIEFKSSDADHGIVLFDKFDYLDYLNLHQESGYSYFSNGQGKDNYFLRSNGRNVEFGGEVSIPRLDVNELSSDQNFVISVDVQNTLTDESGAFIIGSNDVNGGANFNEIFRVEESGAIILNTLDNNDDLTSIIVQDDLTGRLYSKSSLSVGPWDLAEGGLLYHGGNVGIGNVFEPTEQLDIDGSIRLRAIHSTESLTQLVALDENGVAFTRDLSTINLSAWEEDINGLSYTGNVAVNGDFRLTGEFVTSSAVISSMSDGSSLSSLVSIDENGLLHQKSTQSLIGILNNDLNTLVAADEDGNMYRKSIGSIVLNESTNEDDIVIKSSDGLLKTRTVSSLVEGVDATAQNFVVQSADGSLNTRPLSTVSLSPWSVDASTLSYAGDVGIGLSGSLPTQSLDIGGSARFRGVLEDDLQDDFLVLNANGVVKKRSLSSFSPWVKSDDGSYFSNKKFGIGVENLSSDNAVIISTDLRKGLVVESGYESEYGYAIRTDVTRDDAKAFAVYRPSTGSDVFRVFGNGTVEAKEVVVSLDVWHDKVFDSDYTLMPIEQVEQFVSNNHHLPEIPSEIEVLEEGVNVGEMEGLLLKKIEELTLYIIQQNKQLQEQGEKIKALEEKLN